MEKSTLRYVVLTGETGYISFAIEQKNNIRYLGFEYRSSLSAIRRQPAKLATFHSRKRNNVIHGV